MTNPGNGVGCIMCCGPVQYPQFTLLCNACDDEWVRSIMEEDNAELDHRFATQEQTLQGAIDEVADEL